MITMTYRHLLLAMLFAVVAQANHWQLAMSQNEFKALPILIPPVSDCTWPSLTTAEVRDRLEEIGVPQTFERLTGGPRPVSIPTGVPIWDQRVTDRLDALVWQTIACQNAGAWSNVSHQTDDYLRTHLPTVSLDIFDEYVANTTSDTESTVKGEEVLGFAGTFGWIRIDERTMGGYFITGIFAEISPGFATAHPEVRFVVVLKDQGDFLIDDVRVIGELGPTDL
jgi:hypothetical protein